MEALCFAIGVIGQCSKMFDSADFEEVFGHKLSAVFFAVSVLFLEYGWCVSTGILMSKFEMYAMSLILK